MNIAKHENLTVFIYSMFLIWLRDCLFGLRRLLWSHVMNGNEENKNDLVLLVRIRPFRLIIAQPCDEGHERKCANSGCQPGDRQRLYVLPIPALCRESPKPLAATSPGGASVSSTFPVADSLQARVNDDRTEDRGPAIRRMRRDISHNGRRPRDQL